MMADSLVIIDNAFGRAIVVANTRLKPGASPADLRRAFDTAQERIATLLDRLSVPPRLSPLTLDGGPRLATKSAYGRAAFERDVERIKEHTRPGDVFQAVLSRPQEGASSADPSAGYRRLGELNPESE